MIFEKLIIFWYYLRTKYLLRFRSRADLLRWQERQVRSFLRQVLPRSSFYRRYFHGMSLTAWREFPLLDKAGMMANFDELNTVGIIKQDAWEVALRSEQSRDFTPMIHQITVGLSSGTSGNRGIFLVNLKERLIWTGMILAKVLPGSIFSRQKIAFFLRANSNLYDTIKSGRLDFKFFDQAAALAENIQALNDYQPTILVAPASLLRLLAEAQAVGALKITPRKLVSVAEVLEELDRAYIMQQFQQPVAQIYQATEGFLATTCQYGTFHLNEDILVVQKEYLEKSCGKFIPIITDFTRTTQPIIRYRLNDLLTERQTPCPCGSIFTAVEKIEGRTDDIFYLPAKDSSKLLPVFPDFISRAVICATELIEEYKVIQRSTETLEIYLRLPAATETEARSAVEEAVRIALQRLFDRFKVQSPNMIFYNQLPSLAGKKLKRIENLSKYS